MRCTCNASAPRKKKTQLSGYSSRSYWVIKLWALIFCYSATVSANTSSHSPYRANFKLAGVYEIKERQNTAFSELERIPTVTLKGRLRNVGFIDARFSLRRNKTWQADIQKNDRTDSDFLIPKLLQGQVAVGGSWKRAGHRILPSATSIIGNTLKLTFPGRATGSKKSRQRIYTITMQLDGSLVVRASVMSIPRSAGRRGACSSAVGIGSLAKQLESSTNEAHATSDSTIAPISTDEPPKELARVVTISTDADEAWYQRYGEQSNAVIASIINTAEVIYHQQLGIRFRIVQQHVYASGSPYVSANASKLLASFAMNRDNKVNLGNGANSFHADVDLKHLFTGKDLDGGTIGIAYIGTLCILPSMAFGVTQAYADGADAAIFAHELGHNFGANHDVNSPDGLMYPSISFPPAQKFSELSLSEMQTHLSEYGTCVSLEELANLPQQTPTPTPNVQPPSSTTPATITLKQKRVRYQNNRTAIRLTGALSSSGLQPISRVGVLLVIDGQKIARTVTNTNGKYDFLIRLNLPRGKKVPAQARAEGLAITSNQLLLNRT